MLPAMAIVTLEDIHKTYGERHLLRGVSLTVDEGDRIGLVGVNGSGKSTLLKIVAGLEPPDEGVRRARGEARLGYLEQEPRFPPKETLREAVRAGLPGRAEILEDLARVHRALAEAEDAAALLREQAHLEDRLALAGGHAVEHKIEKTIHDLGLPDPDARCGDLSGGERRRVALARLLLGEPDLLLLDEPTNHLDALVIDWLEDQLLSSRTPLLMVTHDRYFLDRVVHRIVELERGALHPFEGGYAEFLAARAERLAAERGAEASRLNLLRRETAWMRRGPPARSTKAKARIRRYEALVDAAPERTAGELEFEIPPGPRLGSKVVRLVGVAKAYGERAVLRDLDLEIGAGERVGIVGPNGAGKTTLLDLCRGALAPDRGRVEIGPTVRFAAIEQSRTELAGGRSVVEEVGDGHSWVRVGERDVRVETFLERFLFPRPMLRTPVGELSGGERNRVLLAKLLLTGGNVLLLDEPTNDLDLMTLRVLEEALLAFAGTVLVVSHDRYFLDRVATRIVYLDGSGRARLHPGDVSGLIDAMKAEREPATRKPKPARERPARPRGLSWKEKRELEELPETIAAAEADLAALDAELADPALYAGPETRVRETTTRRKEKAAEVSRLYARWEELEARA